MSENNKALVRRFVKEVQSQHNLDVLDELFHPEMVNHTVPHGLNVPPGIEGFKLFYSGMIAAFPDVHATINQQFSDGDKVITYKTFHATHQADFMGILPTGKHVEFDVIDIWSIVDGKMKDHWGLVDMMALMQQLGATPT